MNACALCGATGHLRPTCKGTPELAALFAQRQEIDEQIYALRHAKAEMYSARLRLNEWLAEHPNHCTYTLEQIGQAIGCTRERVRQLVEPRRNAASVRAEARLVAYLKEHPEAALPKSYGGMSLKDVGKAIGMTGESVGKILPRLGYPARTELYRHETWGEYRKRRYHEDPEARRKSIEATRRWRAAHPEAFKAINERAGAKFVTKQKATVLEQRTCAACGSTFDWTAYKEQRAKYGKHKGNTCSHSCAMRVRKKGAA